MAEVTRVPLQPIAKGSLTKLWLGIIAAIVLAGVVAWAVAPAGVKVDEVRAGTGESPTAEDVVFVNYTGKLEDGTVFDQSQEAAWPVQGVLPNGTPMALEQMIPGFREALMQMQKGGSYTVRIPSEMAYGSEPPPGAPIPPDADLEFEIELVDYMSREEAEQRFQTMMGVMQQQQMPGAPGVPGGEPGAPGAPPPTGAPPQ